MADHDLKVSREEVWKKKKKTKGGKLEEKNEK